MLEFQSTLPGWGATTQAVAKTKRAKFQSTLPGWGATISRRSSTGSPSDFNPRSPDGERHDGGGVCHAGSLFQSTLPGWGATISQALVDARQRISIHAPRMGSDLPSMVGEPCPVRFQSTLPGWGATFSHDIINTPYQFQSTLPGWGATTTSLRGRIGRQNFNPRSPDGERLGHSKLCTLAILFQSTLPGWGATRPTATSRRHRPNFNPRSPDGERLARHGRPHRPIVISIHAPRMGSDPNSTCWMRSKRTNFNPRSPDGERPRKWTSSPTIWAKSSIFNTDCIADRR